MPVTRTPRKTRFRPLARLCRAGLVTRRVPTKGFRLSLPPFPRNYYSTNIPFLNNGMRYGFTERGTVAGGNAQLFGGIGLRNNTPAGRLVGTLEVLNRGGTMTIDVSTAATTSTLPASFTYRVIAGTGTDRIYRGATGMVTITATQTNSMSFGPVSFANGTSTITFA